MSASPTTQFGISNEIHNTEAGGRVRRSESAFQQLMQAAQKAVSPSEERATASQVADHSNLRKKAMTFAERNVVSAFEFAWKIVQTKDFQKLVQMQTEFLQSQMQALGEQVNDLGETVSKAGDRTARNPHRSDLSRRCTRTEPLLELRPSPPPRHVPDGNGFGFLLPDRRQPQLLTPCDAGVE